MAGSKRPLQREDASFSEENTTTDADVQGDFKIECGLEIGSKNISIRAEGG